MILELLAAATIASPSSRAQEVLSRVSEKVVEISNQLKKTYVGKIKSIGTNTIIVNSSDGEKTLLTNDVTVFYRFKSGSRAEINLTSLKIGDDLAAIGTVDPQSSDLTAREIIAKVARVPVVGKIEANNNNTLTVKEFSGQITKVDISDALVLEKNLAAVFTNAKFSDFKVGSITATICYLDPATSTLLALKAIVVNY